MINALTMKRHFSRKLLFSLMAMGIASTAPVLYAQNAGVDSSVTSRETARRQQALRSAMLEVENARQAYKDKRYTKAVEYYRNALALVPKVPATEKQRKFIQDCLSDALIARAMDYRSVGRREEAIAFLEEAIELSPNNKRARQELTHTLDPVRTNPALTPQHIGEVSEVTRLLELAYGYYDLGKFDDAIKTFEAVLAIDKYNTAAQRGIEAASTRRSRYYEAAHDAFRANVLEKVDAEWSTRNSSGDAPEIVSQPAALAEGGTFSEAEAAFEYNERLSAMVIPQIVFEDASIVDVIEALTNQIRRFEAESQSPSSKPLNLILNIPNTDQVVYDRLMAKPISLNLSNVSIKDVLDMVAQQTGVMFYHTPVGMEITYSGRDFGPIIERTFTVPPHFFDKAKDSGSSDEDDIYADEAPVVSVARLDPVQALKSMGGISFPKGATASYSAATRRLVVRNTLHNLREIEELLSNPMDSGRQIILNVIAMEVQEDDLEELGFHWMFQANFDGRTTTAGGIDQSHVTNVPTIQTGIQTIDSQQSPVVTGGLRSGSQVFTAAGMDRLIEVGSAANFAQGTGQPAPSIFGFRGVWKNIDVTMIMNGLSQKKGTDFLQNPRVILSPDNEEQVVFANVKELFFPTAWSAPQVPDNSGNNNWNNWNNNWDDDDEEEEEEDEEQNFARPTPVVAGATPEDFVRFGMVDDTVGGIGAILQVHSAEVSDDGQFVTLAFTTTVNEFEGFVNWGSPITSVTTAADGTPHPVVLTPNHILMPIIKRYMENTQITIVPGSVIVIGGMKEAKVVQFEDKVPVLGDLPLVGRLFRSSGEQKVRKALIFFAKVDVVDPTGRDVLTGERPSQATESM